MHAEKRAEAAVAPVEFHVDQPGRQRVHRRAAVTLDTVADNTQLGQLLDQRPGKLRPFPVTVDHRQDLSVDELAGPDQIVLLLRGERLT